MMKSRFSLRAMLTAAAMMAGMGAATPAQALTAERNAPRSEKVAPQRNRSKKALRGGLWTPPVVGTEYARYVTSHRTTAQAKRAASKVRNVRRNKR